MSTYFSSYKRTNQIDKIVEILGNNSQSWADPVIPPSGGTTYFARGHITPDADFTWDQFQTATYFFVNVAPQYTGFNGGNWKQLEESVRDKALG